MAFTNYTIVPEDGVVVIDGQVAGDVSMAGIPANVHAIQWNGLRNSGTIEYNINPTTGVLPAPGSFSSSAAYSAQTTEAEAILYAANNPVTYYVTSDEAVYAGQIYTFGSPLVIFTPNPVQPDFTTLIVPPTPEDWQALYWYDDAWLLSSFDPNLLLVNAQEFLIQTVNENAAEQGNNEARIYSTVQLFAAADVDALLTADYQLVTLGDYQIFLDGQVTTLEATINAATTTAELYSFDPSVSGTYV